MRTHTRHLVVILLCALAAPLSRAESPAGEPLDNLAPPTASQLADAQADRAAAEGALAALRSPDPGRETMPPPLGLSEIVGPLLKTFLMLGVVLAIAYLSLHKGLGKLVERQTAGKRVKVIERVGLDAKRALFLVEIDGKQMLLGGGDAGVVHLKDLDRPVPPPETKGGLVARLGSFGEALERKADKSTVTASLPRSDASAAEGANS